jgi:outer membrane protein assembly factor BamB
MIHPAPAHAGHPRPPAISRTVTALLMLAFIGLPAFPTGSAAHIENPDLGDMTVGVLLYLDDGQYRWTDVPITGNFTALCATIAACAALDVQLNYSISQYGAYVTSLFGTGSPQDFSWWWELLLWNSTANAWQEAPLGASDLRPQPWASIAWCPNSSAPPLPDPLTRYPWPKFRGDIANTGMALAPYPSNWTGTGIIGGSSNGPIDSSPVIAHGRVYVSTGGVYNWSRMTYEKPPRLWSSPVGYPIPGIYEIGGSGLILPKGQRYERETTAAGWQVSTPAVGGGMVVIGTSDGKVLAFDMEDLDPLWNFSIAPSSTGVTSSPVIFQNTVYIAGGDGQLYALSLDGKKIWNISLGGPAYMSSPAISKGRLYVGSDAGVMTCAALNGTFIWNFTTGGKIRSSPAVYGDHVYFEDTVYDGFNVVSSTFFALKADNGTQEWKKTIPAATSSPAVANGRIFLGTNTGVLALDLSGTQIWFHPTGGPVQSSPAVASGSVIICENSPNGTMRVLAASDGRELSNLTPDPRQYMFASAAFSDNMLIFASDNGQVCYRVAGAMPYLSKSPIQISGPIKAGKPMDVKFTITNTGALASRDIRIKLWESPGHRLIDAPINITHLAPGKNVTAVFNWTPREDSKTLSISVIDDSRDYFGPSVDVPQPEKWHYPAMFYYVSGAVFITFAAVAFIILRKKGRKGGRTDEP